MNQYQIIRGNLWFKGYAAEADSMHFVAQTTPSRFKKINVLRLEGIDSLETFYRGLNQPTNFSFEYFISAVEIVGLSMPIRNLLKNFIIQTGNTPEVLVAIRTLDIYSRRVGILFPPDTDLVPGQFYLPEDLPITESYNYRFLGNGWTYPAYYKGTSQAIIDAFKIATEVAQTTPAGIWLQDTNQPVDLSDFMVLQDSQVIHPKYFRFLVDFLFSRAEIAEFEGYKNSTSIAINYDGEQIRFGDLFTFTDPLVLTEVNWNLVTFLPRIRK